jgi:hypothetical protein
LIPEEADGGALGGYAHCNSWNAINGTESNGVYSISAITLSPSSFSSFNQHPLIDTG